MLVSITAAVIAHRMNRRGAWVIAPASAPLIAIGALFAGAGHDYDGMAFLAQSEQVGGLCLLAALLCLIGLAVVGVKQNPAAVEAR